MTTVRERKIASGINKIRQGVSQRKAAKRWDIPRQTIANRLQGKKPREEYNQKLIKLSPEQKAIMA